MKEEIEDFIFSFLFEKMVYATRAAFRRIDLVVLFFLFTWFFNYGF